MDSAADDMPPTGSPSISPLEDRSLLVNSIASRNPFSIDYILSANSVALEATRHQQEQATLVDQLNFMNQQQQVQMMPTSPAPTLAASTAPTSSYSSSSSSSIQMPPVGRTNGHKQLQNQLAQLQQEETKIEHQQQTRQQHQQQAQPQPAHPNFLYFMAYMLLQQQQQQQQAVAAATAAAAAAAVDQQQQLQLQQQHQQQNSRQPINMTTSNSMGSLAILARLTATDHNEACSSSTSNSQHVNTIANSNNPYNQIGNTKPIRHQPYPQAIIHHQSNSNKQKQINASTNDKPNHQTPGRQPTDYSSILSLGFEGAQLLQPQKHFKANQSQLLDHLAGKLGPVRTNLIQNNVANRCAGQSSTVGASNKVRSPQQAANQSTTTPIRDQSSSFLHPITGEKLDNQKPAHSYIGLIGMCILSSPDKRMVLNDIYQFILDNYPYYRNRGSGWRNSVRHNLSLNECFQKAGRAANGKGHYWTIHPANMEDFMNGDFRRRRAQRKVRRYNHMDVPSDESDDESMEDATRPPLPEHFKRSIEMHKRLDSLKKQHQSQLVSSNQLQITGSLQPPQLTASALSTTAFAPSSLFQPHLY